MLAQGQAYVAMLSHRFPAYTLTEARSKQKEAHLPVGSLFQRHFRGESEGVEKGVVTADPIEGLRSGGPNRGASGTGWFRCRCG
jgi:hypothetical protein